MNTGTALRDAAPEGDTRRPAPLVRHSLLLARRGLAKSARNPGALVNGVMTPALFLVLFVYLFGGSVSGSPDAYLQYLFPGILVMGAGLSGMLSSGLSINIDMKKGVFDRFRSLPVSRLAPFSARSWPTWSGTRSLWRCCSRSASSWGSGSGPTYPPRSPPPRWRSVSASP